MSTKHQKVTQVIVTLKASDEAIPFATLCEKVGEKYPQDLVAAMYALQEVGLIDATKDHGRSMAYRWVGDTLAPKRRSRAKKADEVAA